MRRSISRRSFLSRVSAVGAVAGTGFVAMSKSTTAQDADPWQDFGIAESFAALDSASNPDPEHVLRQGGGWRVLPNGADDHDNLEWALLNTVPGGAVRLVAGTYKLGSPVHIADFDGVLVGAGAARTTITCADAFNYELWEAPGGGKERGEPKPPPFPRASINGAITRPAPGYLMFYKTPLQSGEIPEDRANRIEVRNLRCRNAAIGEPWMFGDTVLAINVINSMDWHNPEVEHETTRQDVLVSGIEVDGYRSPAFGPFETACGCVGITGGLRLTANYNLDGVVDGDAQGFANGGLLGFVPAEGDVTIRSCTFRDCRVGPGVYGYRNGVVTFENNTTDGCRANCHAIWDVGGSRITMRSNDLHCDTFLLPPELADGATDVPGSLGCMIVLQGVEAAIGYAYNVQWLALANDHAAHERHPEAGPLGTWRPRGPVAAPQPSDLRAIDNHCESSTTPNTYCVHVIDVAKAVFGLGTVRALVLGNACEGSETCVSLEHVEDGRVLHNECASQSFGIELYDSPAALKAGNTFDFPPGVPGCEIRVLAPGEKIDFSRVVAGAGVCVPQ